MRCLAALMLQHQWLCLPASEVDEHSDFFRLLGLKSSEEPVGPLVARGLAHLFTEDRGIFEPMSVAVDDRVRQP